MSPTKAPPKRNRKTHNLEPIFSVFHTSTCAMPRQNMQRNRKIIVWMLFVAHRLWIFDIGCVRALATLDGVGHKQAIAKCAWVTHIASITPSIASVHLFLSTSNIFMQNRWTDRPIKYPNAIKRSENIFKRISSYFRWLAESASVSYILAKCECRSIFAVFGCPYSYGS